MVDEVHSKVEVEGQQQRKKGRVQYKLNYPVPEVRSSLEKDIKVMRAFVTSSDFGQKFVGRKDVAPYTNLNEQIVGGILTFFIKIGLAEKEGYTYKPSLELINFENELKYESEDVAGKALKPIILNTWFGEMAVKIFRAESNPLSHDELFKRLGKMAGADPEYHKSAINHLIGYLSFSKLVKYNEEEKLYSINVETDSREPKSNTEQTPISLTQVENKQITENTSKIHGNVDTIQDKQEIPSIPNTCPNFLINLNLEITDSSNPETIKEIIQTLINEIKR